MALSQHPEKMKKGVIENWHPEDKAFWEKTGQKIASRNLWISCSLSTAILLRLDAI